MQEKGSLKNRIKDFFRIQRKQKKKKEKAYYNKAKITALKIMGYLGACITYPLIKPKERKKETISSREEKKNIIYQLNIKIDEKRQDNPLPNKDMETPKKNIELEIEKKEEEKQILNIISEKESPIELPKKENSIQQKIEISKKEIPIYQEMETEEPVKEPSPLNHLKGEPTIDSKEQKPTTPFFNKEEKRNHQTSNIPKKEEPKQQEISNILNVEEKKQKEIPTIEPKSDNLPNKEENMDSFYISVEEIKNAHEIVTNEILKEEAEIYYLQKKLMKINTEKKKKTILGFLKETTSNLLQIGILIPLFKLKFTYGMVGTILLNHKIKKMNRLIKQEKKIKYYNIKEILKNIETQKDFLMKTIDINSNSLQELNNLKREVTKINSDSLEVEKLLKDLDQLEIQILEKNKELEEQLEKTKKLEEKGKTKIKKVA